MGSQIPDTPPPGFDDLTRQEQIEYVQRLWNRIAAAEGELEVPEWHRQILRERLSTPSSEEDSSWDDVKRRLEQRQRG